MSYLSHILSTWPFWRQLLFRFCFSFILLLIAPWTWLFVVPGGNVILEQYHQFTTWLVESANSYFFRIWPVLVPTNGSSDTSFGWASLLLRIATSVVATVIWSAIDHKRTNYYKLNYWLCLLARYYVGLYAFLYGVIKLFRLQMPFPNLSQLATPLGDFLPMRLSWMFIGYSGPYQFFSGMVETIACMLLLYRRTATLGVMLATSVFINVVMLNLAYDIPVKIFSLELLFVCLFLLGSEAKRIICFFVLNKPAPIGTLYTYQFPKRWMRYFIIAVKSITVVIVMFKHLEYCWDSYRDVHKCKPWEPLSSAVYYPQLMIANSDTVVAMPDDSLLWKDIIFMGDGNGSIKTSDKRFQHRYGRGYFNYSFDTSQKVLELKKMDEDNGPVLASFNYSLPDSNTLVLAGKSGNDLLFLRMIKSTHRYQLAEKPFHWLGDHNR